jgi:hypothetical protein
LPSTTMSPTTRAVRQPDSAASSGTAKNFMTASATMRTVIFGKRCGLENGLRCKLQPERHFPCPCGGPYYWYRDID